MLNAINSGKQPERDDVAKLERWVPDEPFDHAPDDLARIVVERELEKSTKKQALMGYEDPLMYLPHKAVQTFVRRQSIYDFQRPASHLYLVIRGRVKIINTVEDGCPIIARIVRAEGLFGESCLVLSQPAGEAVALDNVTLMAWTPTDIEQQVEREPRLGLALTQYMVRTCIELLDRIESMAAYNTPQRVMLALAQLAIELGTKMPDGTVRLQSLTHHTIAEYVGTSREIVSLEMNRLRRLGVLSYSRKHIDVYREAIEDDLRQHGITLPYAHHRSVVPPANQAWMTTSSR